MALIIITTAALLVIHTLNEIDFYLSIKKEAAYKSINKKRKTYKS